MFCSSRKGKSCLASFARLSITMDYPCGDYACPGSVSFCPITFIAYHVVCPVPNFLPLYETKGFKSVLIPTGDKTESKRASKDLASSARKHWDPLREGSRAARTWMECHQGWSGDQVAIAWGPLLGVREIQEWFSDSRQSLLERASSLHIVPKHNIDQLSS